MQSSPHALLPLHALTRSHGYPLRTGVSHYDLYDCGRVCVVARLEDPVCLLATHFADSMSGVESTVL